ncbi:hypothetical protein AX14_002048, partial [Amanita brunnescens Koide BX004]
SYTKRRKNVLAAAMKAGMKNSQKGNFFQVTSDEVTIAQHGWTKSKSSLEAIVMGKVYLLNVA